MKKAIEIRDKSDVELRERLAELRKELFERQFRSGQDEVEERGRFRKLRRDVARIQTILRERELGIRVAGAGSAARATGSGESAASGGEEA